MPQVGAQRSWENKWKFRVEIDGVLHAGFQKCSEVKAEFDDVDYREGGVITADKSPGLQNWDDLTLERGAVATDSDMYDWFMQCGDAQTDTGLVDYAFRRTLDVVVMDRDDSVLKRWRLYEAYPKSFCAGDWDNDSSEKTIEKSVLRYRYARRIPGGGGGAVIGLGG